MSRGAGSRKSSPERRRARHLPERETAGGRPHSKGASKRQRPVPRLWKSCRHCSSARREPRLPVTKPPVLSEPEDSIDRLRPEAGEGPVSVPPSSSERSNIDEAAVRAGRPEVVDSGTNCDRVLSRVVNEACSSCFWLSAAGAPDAAFSRPESRACVSTGSFPGAGSSARARAGEDRKAKARAGTSGKKEGFISRDGEHCVTSSFHSRRPTLRPYVQMRGILLRKCKSLPRRMPTR